MVVAELRKMTNSNRNIIDGFLDEDVPRNNIFFFFELALDDVEGHVQVWFRFVVDESDGCFYAISGVRRKGSVDFHQQLVVCLREVVGWMAELKT